MPDSKLILKRFNGEEAYPIKRATWSLSQDPETGIQTLCLSIEAGAGFQLCEDTKELNAEPLWEINIIDTNLKESSLAPNTAFSVLSDYDETNGGYQTNFYYCSHEGTTNNQIRILAKEGSRLLLQISGQTKDVNFYDGSKPPTKLFLESWFSHNPETKRSIR